MSERRTLPQRRASQTLTIEHRGRLYQMSISHFDVAGVEPGQGGGDPAEVFVFGPKSGEDLNDLLRDAGIIASLALQYGCPVDTLRGSLSRNEDKPQSIIGAVVDAMAGGDVLG